MRPIFLGAGHLLGDRPAQTFLPSGVQWRTKIDSMLEQHPRLLAVSIHNKLKAEGFEGCYPTVVRAVRRSW